MQQDQRIRTYRDAALSMLHGRFRVEMPTAPNDEVGALGQALVDLGRALERRFDELQALNTVTERINAGFVLDEVVSQIYDSFRSLIPFDRIGLALIEEGGQSVVTRWARSDGTDLKLGKGYSAPLRGSSLGRIIETREPRILNDLTAYLSEHPESESTALIVSEGIRSSLTCPLVALGKPVGFLFFSSRETNRYRDVHVDLFEQIAGQLSVIIEKGRLYQQLIELNALKDRFLGMAVHDLRNPLSVVRGYLALLEQGVVGPVTQEQRELLERALRACGMMSTLVDDLLDVSAIESGHLTLETTALDVEAILRVRLESDRLLASRKHIAVDIDIAPNLPLVRMDPVRIHQVVDNLVSNAIKFSKPGSRVTISAQRVGDAVHVRVTDEGPGIPAAEQPRLFAAFGRTSVRPTDGEPSTGLGLAIVRRVIEAHGGHTWVDSTIGSGSTFSFSLPVTVVPPPASKDG